MPGTYFQDGPAFITDTSDDLYAPASGQYALVRHIRLVNTDTNAIVVSLWVTTTGAETAGTEILKDHSLAAKGTSAAVLDLYFPAGLKLTNTSGILVGDAGTTNKVTATIMGELYVV